MGFLHVWVFKWLCINELLELESYIAHLVRLFLPFIIRIDQLDKLTTCRTNRHKLLQGCKNGKRNSIISMIMTDGSSAQCSLLPVTSLTLKSTTLSPQPETRNTLIHTVNDAYKCRLWQKSMSMSVKYKTTFSYSRWDSNWCDGFGMEKINLFSIHSLPATMKNIIGKVRRTVKAKIFNLTCQRGIYILKNAVNLHISDCTNLHWE